jgi:hypothetical protein
LQLPTLAVGFQKIVESVPAPRALVVASRLHLARPDVSIAPFSPCAPVASANALPLK